MKVDTIGIAGLGLLGSGIATCLLSHGFRVVAYDPSPDARGRARAAIADGIDDLVRRGGFPSALREEWPARYAEADSIAAGFGPCDFVIESVFEDLDVKRRVFDEVEAAVAPGVPVASNTSALPITLLQSGRARPARFVGMHWLSPCHITRFLEVIRGAATDDATADATLALGRRCGKEPALVRKDVEGFLVNRLAYAVYREAFHLLESGVADVATIDGAFRNVIGLWGSLMGPFRWMDLTGLPAYAAVMERLMPTLSRDTGVPRTMRELVAGGAKGAANLRGFYHYTPEEAEGWQRRLDDHVWAQRQPQSPAGSPGATAAVELGRAGAGLD